MLENGSSKAEHLVDELRPALSALGLDAALDDLCEAIEDGEFEDAAQKVVALRRQLEERNG